jgi:hypothetical protein
VTGWAQFAARGRAQKASAAQATADGDLFDAQGFPTRAPRNQQEVIQFMFAAANAARKLQEHRVTSAMSALKYGLGLSLHNSPYSLSAMASPYLRDMANANLSVQYQQPDYSYFLRPDAWGGQAAGPTGGGSVTAGAGPGLPASFMNPTPVYPQAPATSEDPNQWLSPLSGPVSSEPTGEGYYPGQGTPKGGPDITKE